jgi:hypothetical protein
MRGDHLERGHSPRGQFRWSAAERERSARRGRRRRRVNAGAEVDQRALLPPPGIDIHARGIEGRQQRSEIEFAILVAFHEFTLDGWHAHRRSVCGCHVEICTLDSLRSDELAVDQRNLAGPARAGALRGAVTATGGLNA